MWKVLIVRSEYMAKAKRIFFVADTKDLTDKLLLVGLRKQVKGLIRLGHDTQVFSYNNVIIQASFRKWKIVGFTAVVAGAW